MPPVLMPMIKRYRLIFVANATINLSGYTGSAWRGLFGHSLRQLCCVTRASECRGCLLERDCIYATVFESISSDSGRYHARPHPFVLMVPFHGKRSLKPGETITLGITLMGQAISAAPYLIAAMREAGRLGMGRNHAQFSLYRADAETHLGMEDWLPVTDNPTSPNDEPIINHPRIPKAPETADIVLLTPLRIKRKGQLIGPREFLAADFLRQLWRRAKDISHFYADASQGMEITLPNSRADELNAHALVNLAWRDWSRYSSRQKTLIKMGGVVGHIQLHGELVKDWWPLLWMGQWLLLGKGTSMGLGQYKIHRRDQANPRNH